QCRNGWYGMDCSVPSISSYNLEWPKWLVPLKVDHLQGNNTDHASTVAVKKRPLIYVYDLPPEFNALLLQGRHDKGHSVNRLYDAKNRTDWTSILYGSQMSIYESMLASPHRTLNGDEADYFFVPVFDSWMIPLVDENPHLSKKVSLFVYAHYTSDLYKKAYDHIMAQYPYWNRSSGRDHIWTFAWDEGACMAPKEVWNGVMLVHWGNTNKKHRNSTTAYNDDNWDSIPQDLRGNHSCFDPVKDIVIPVWKNPKLISSKSHDRPREDRKTLFYFNGNLGPLYNGRPEDRYSMGIRQKMGEEFGSSPNKEGKLGKQR
ncbi:adenylosuccinate synthetase, partial [Genlisea aurea]